MDADGIASTECPLPSEPIIIISNSNSSSCPQSDLPPPSSTSYLNGNEHHESSCNGDANFIQKEDFEIKYEKEEEEEEGEDENAFPEHSNSGEQQQQQLLPSLTESDDTTIETAAINNVLKAETGEPDSIQSSENNIIGHDDEDDDYRINFAPTFRPMRRRLNPPPPPLPLPPLMSALKRPKQEEEEDPCRPSSPTSFEPSFDANLIVPTKRAHIAVTAATVPGWLLNRHLSRLDIFSKESGAALAKRRAQRKSLQLQIAQEEKGKSNSGQHLPAPVTKEDHRLPAVPGPSNGAATVAPYICQRCAHRFTSKETLKLHMWLHREMKWEDDDDSENTAATTNSITAATITTNGPELNDIDVEKVKSEPGAIITNGLSSPSDYIYDDDDLDYDDDDYDDDDDDDDEDALLDERDPEVDEMGQVKLKPFSCYLNDDDDDDSEEEEEEEEEKYEVEEEEDDVYENHGTMNGGYQSDEYEDRQNFEQQQSKILPLPPPPTRPSAKRQKALQKKTSRYMSKKLEKLAALPQVLTGNQLPPTIDGKFVTVSLACPACKLSLPDKDQLDAHLLSVHQLHPFRCLLPGCEASFGTSDELTDHISTDHDSAGPYVCGLCTTNNSNADKNNSSSAAAQGATQPSYKLLAIHHLNYHQRGVFRCPVGGGCQATAPYRVLAIRHYHLVHLPYACTWKHCKRTFAYQPELEAHQAGHAAPRPFSCTAPACGKTFLTKAHLAEHERIHTGVKPFLCTFPLCDYAAKTRNSVLVHVRSKHLGMTRMSAAEKAEAERRHDPQQYVAVRRELL
ncbi:hypothetical protein TYRP_015577 [Tyrophagus putrescentiae]|nr:hypothetical protein TYRP_015577 [Tyrophagus putrescentiae]